MVGSMNRIYSIFIVVLLFSVTACERGEYPADGEKVRVSISTGNASTRTTVADNGLTTLWQGGDRIAVWAGDGKLSAEPFVVNYTDGRSARFTADITPMGDGSYTYYSVYPCPETVSGTTAEFTLASEQSGSYDGQNDILVAYPAEGGALENKDTQIELTYRHKMHALRMFIPEGGNGLGEPVEYIDIEFPQNVAGRVGVDFSDPTAAATLTDGSSWITVSVPEGGLNESPDNARKYAYAIVFPAQMSETEQIVFKVRSATQQGVVTFPARAFSEGGSTPVRLVVTPERHTILRFRIVANNLGEDPQRVTFTAPEGYDLGGGSNSLTVTASETFDRYGYCDLDVTDLNDLSGKELTVEFESANAIVSSTVTLPSYQQFKTTSVSLTVPYLFEETFDAISSFERNTEFSGSDAKDPSAAQLDEYGLAGWTGARVGGQTGSGIRICCRLEMGLWAQKKYRGRVDTAPMGALKSGSTVKLRVSFVFGSNLFEGTGSGGSTTYWAGSTVKSGGIKGTEDIENVVIGETTIDCDGNKDNAPYYGTTPHSQSFEVASAGNTTRLSWLVGANRKAEFAGNGNYWLYIDDIRVSIVQ